MTIKQTENPSNILLVCDDMTSHCYAAAKLACVYEAAGHKITLATAEGKPHNVVVEETQHAKNVECLVVGTSNTVKCLNEHDVISANSWSTFWYSLLNPFPFADIVPTVILSSQEGMYEPLRELIKYGDFDVIVSMHCMVATCGDAIDSLGEQVTAPIVCFSSFPYDPFSYNSSDFRTWFMPRTFTSYPHVGLYSSNRPKNIIQNLIQYFWQFTDGLVSTYKYWKSSRIHSAYRKQRGLGPVSNGLVGWFRKYPSIVIGGVEPFLDPNAQTAIRPQDTVIGTLDAPNRRTIAHDPALQEWLNKADNGVVYVGFGTGVELSDTEAAAVTGDLLRSMETYEGQPPILFALRPSEQQRLRPVFDAAIGSPPTSESESHLEYLNGRLRIQVVPQADLLMSGKVRVFVSHMGMGGFSEGLEGGNVFVCYPAFADQYFNSQRAVDAGVGVMAQDELQGLGELVKQVMDDTEMKQRAEKLATTLPDGELLVIDALERVIVESKQEKQATGSTATEQVPELKADGEGVPVLDSTAFVEEEIARRVSAASAGAA